MRGLQTPALFAASLADEYVPHSVDSTALMERLCAATPGRASTLLLPVADHAVSGPQAAQDALIERVRQFVGEVAGQGRVE